MAGKQEKSFVSKIFDTAGESLQHFTPVNQIQQHVCGLHYYANDPKRIVESHHYCSHTTDDMHQCIIYDNNTENAKIIGIEYIITKNLFDSLPADEKKYWHSHVYEVKSGTLFMPFGSKVPKTIGDKAEHKEMEHLVNTYGKTWHLWQVDRGDALPLGEPQLMMSFTRDGQVPSDYIRQYEAKHNINFEEKKKQRENIMHQTPDPMADAFSY
ncbi:hypothetical protein BJ944DRAFT_229076 [Cunninghamella echinulata]|nr:hypothetical protein BJ944DRAFT_229076 [Cunninghamella echinulata]